VKILREYLYLHSDMGVEFHVPLPMILEWRAKDDEGLSKPQSDVVAVYYRYSSRRWKNTVDGEYVYKLEGVRIK